MSAAVSFRPPCLPLLSRATPTVRKRFPVLGVSLPAAVIWPTISILMFPFCLFYSVFSSNSLGLPFSPYCHCFLARLSFSREHLLCESHTLLASNYRQHHFSAITGARGRPQVHPVAHSGDLLAAFLFASLLFPLPAAVSCLLSAPEGQLGQSLMAPSSTRSEWGCFAVVEKIAVMH